MTDYATHPTFAALLRAVLDDPEDDAPRLILADCLKEHDRWAWADVLRLVLDHPDADPPRLLAAQWCDEHADPARAEFVRVQCRLAELAAGKPPAGWVTGGDWPRIVSAEGKRLRCRERDLLAACADALSLSFPEPGTFGSLEFRAGEALAYRRGFVDAVTCTAADWLAHADAILEAQPVTAVTLTTRPDNDALHLRWSKLPGGGFLSENPRCPAEDDHRQGSWTKFFLGEIWPRVAAWTLPDEPTVFETVDAMTREMREPDGSRFGTPVLLGPGSIHLPGGP